MKIRLAAAWSDIQNDGLQDFTTNACPGYKYVQEDREAITWDTAFKEVEDAIALSEQKAANENAKKDARKDKIEKDKAA